MAQPLPIEQRRVILQREVERLVKRGYRVTSQTDTTAQLVKPKRFSLFWAIFWFCFLIVGLIGYLLFYAAARDEQVYIVVDDYGRVQRK